MEVVSLEHAMSVFRRWKVGLSLLLIFINRGDLAAQVFGLVNEIGPEPNPDTVTFSLARGTSAMRLSLSGARFKEFDSSDTERADRLEVLGFVVCITIWLQSGGFVYLYEMPNQSSWPTIEESQAVN